ncbi:radical SAM protein [Syntrophomonas wolfei]|uniref:radical SAM protein n=2 Tax=Syntrophomonas wolfei TaxID=863 RepID=UPI0009E7E0D3|nr:radical SAM protein [Syntrophomonas wolfei]
MSIFCEYCEWHCHLGKEQEGYCKMYREEQGKVVEIYPFAWNSFGVTHIESLPFFHAYPGSRSLLLGSAGCNFDCQYCSNAHVARVNPKSVNLWHLQPEKLLTKARQSGCHNIVFAINEPTVSWPSLRALGETAREQGIEMGCMSNGYFTPRVANEMAETFSFINISLKAMNRDFYQRYIRVTDIAPVLRNIAYLAEHTHLEITTPIIQGLNDGDIPSAASFIASQDPEIPWHVFRLLPEYQMKDMLAPSIEAIEYALQEQENKLAYIYFGNFVGSEWVNTVCPDCGKVLVERINLGGCGAKSLACHLQGDCCPSCGRRLRLLGEWTSWNKGGAQIGKNSSY